MMLDAKLLHVRMPRLLYVVDIRAAQRWPPLFQHVDYRIQRFLRGGG